MRISPFVVDGAAPRSSAPMRVRQTDLGAIRTILQHSSWEMALPPALGDIGGFVDAMHSWEYRFPLRLARTRPNLRLRTASDPPLSTLAPLLGRLSLLGSPPASRGPFPLKFDWMADFHASAIRYVNCLSLPSRHYIPMVTRPPPSLHVASHTFDWLVRCGSAQLPAFETVFRFLRSLSVHR